MKTAFITGITGMDGYYLSNFLIKNGYEIHGLIRATSSIEHLDKRIHFHIGDWTSLQILFELILPNEIYHLAAQSNVGTSFQNPKLSVETDIEGIVYILEAIKKSGLISSVKLFNACSSEMYAGTDRNVLITENTLMSPQSPYALAKQFSFSMVKLYRDVYGLFGCNGILFNHTGPLRRNNFVCKKITSSIKKISDSHKTRIYKKRSEETKIKMSLASKGKKKSEEHKLNLSLSKKGASSPMQGKKHTLESIAKMSESKKGNIPWNKGMKKEAI